MTSTYTKGIPRAIAEWAEGHTAPAKNCFEVNDDGKPRSRKAAFRRVHQWHNDGLYCVITQWSRGRPIKGWHTVGPDIVRQW